MEKKFELPELTSSTWFDTSFQTRFDAWYDRALGLRDYFVRTDNQINFLLFHQISNEQHSSLVLGKEDVLYERDYIKNYLKLDSQPISKIQAVAKNIKDLQDILAAHGIPFLFVISPSKATIYPEYIPDYMLLRKKDQILSNYQKMIPFLEAYGINYFDGQKFIAGLKERTDFRLFPKGGTHWNFFASYQMTLQLMRRMETLMQKRMHKLPLKKIDWDRAPRRSDDDLARLTNLWDLTPFMEENPYPVVEREAVAGAVLPNLLLAGASFANAPYWYLTTNQLISKDSDRYVYYHMKSLQDMDQSIFDRDIVLLESTVLELPFLNRGFMPLVLSEYNKNRSPHANGGS